MKLARVSDSALTLNGEAVIRADAEASGLDEGRDRVSGRFGDGEGDIRVSTGSGRITLRQ